MHETEGIVLSENDKYCLLDVAAIEAASEVPLLSKDAGMAWELYRDGLECALGKTVLHGAGVDPAARFIADHDVQEELHDLRRSGYPVYLGPHAETADGLMTVVVSDARSSSFGLWTPRQDVEFDPGRVRYTRLN